MKRAAVCTVLAAGMGLLSGCGEKPQTNAEGVKFDAAPWTGTRAGEGQQANAGTAFTAPGWQVGDRAAWQQQLKVRTQNGQNDYVKDN